VDVEEIDTLNPKSLVWVNDTVDDNFNSKWADDDTNDFEWAEPAEEAYRTEIFDANTAIQLHIEGDEIGDDFALVGIEFKDILMDE
jgi:hypothetical protein